jgi:protein involved in polysaccharide export with SLBB domain
LLQLIGEVEVEGKTPAELRDELLRLYAPHLNAPEIAVVVRSFQERRVFVGGQVMAPGTIEMPGEMNVLEAIMQAGGFNLREAELRNVVVIRHRNGQRYGYSINLKPALSGDETQSFYLEPKDIVYVPRTEIAQVNQWIDQHINKIIPDTGLFFMRTSGKTTIGVGTYR